MLYSALQVGWKVEASCNYTNTLLSSISIPLGFQGGGRLGSPPKVQFPTHQDLKILYYYFNYHHHWVFPKDASLRKTLLDPFCRLNVELN